jgi:hypothetical protein
MAKLATRAMDTAPVIPITASLDGDADRHRIIDTIGQPPLRYGF